VSDRSEGRDQVSMVELRRDVSERVCSASGVRSQNRNRCGGRWAASKTRLVISVRFASNHYAGM
jgi:hypothetical protein